MRSKRSKYLKCGIFYYTFSLRIYLSRS